MLADDAAATVAARVTQAISADDQYNPRADAFPWQLFRAYDIRGRESLLRPAVVCAIAEALVEQLQQQGQQQLVLGFDARLSSPVYARIVAQVARSAGLTVQELGCCATPMMYFYARECAGNGIMITASHNPKHDNGMKWLIQGEPPSPEQIQAIAQRAAVIYAHDQQHHENNNARNVKSEKDNPLNQMPHLSAGTQPLAQQLSPHQAPICFEISQPKLGGPYQQAICQDIQLKRRFKVVLDAMHGSAGPCAVQVLSQLGCEVIALRCEPNGHFPEHAPDPSHATHLQGLKQQLLAHHADIGIALDGDGDRVVLMDETGHIISPDRIMALCASMCLARHPQHEVVFDVKCSKMVRDTICAHGGTATMLRTGSSFLRQYLRASNGRAVFGGEYAGHYVFNDGRGLGYDDGLYAALRIMEHWSNTAFARFSSLMVAFPERAYSEDTYIATQQHPAAEVFAELLQQSAHLPVECSQIDGVRLDFASGFGIMRASNTGDYFTVRFDAVNPSELYDIRQCFVRMLQAKYPDIAAAIAQIACE